MQNPPPVALLSHSTKPLPPNDNLHVWMAAGVDLPAKCHASEGPLATDWPLPRPQSLEPRLVFSKMPLQCFTGPGQSTQGFRSSCNARLRGGSRHPFLTESLWFASYMLANPDYLFDSGQVQFLKILNTKRRALTDTHFLKDLLN